MLKSKSTKTGFVDSGTILEIIHAIILMMRSRCSIATSVVALLLSFSTNETSLAFGPPALLPRTPKQRCPHRSSLLHPSSCSTHQRPRPTTIASGSSSTRLELSFIVDTTAFFLLAASSAVDSSSQLNSNEGLAEAVGTLALLSSVGMGVFGSKVTNPNWKYEYKTGAKNNDNNHSVATNSLPPIITIATTTSKEETKQSVLTPIITTNDSMPKEAKEVVIAKAEPITTAAVAVASGGMVVDKKSVSPVAVVAKTKPMTLPPPPPPPVAIKPPPVVPEQGKASIPSKEILQSTEIAKVEVQKVGVAETKERMSTKSSGTLSSSSSSLPPPLEEDLSSLTEVGIVGEPKRSRGKKTVKGLSLLVAAGVVALARNVVKAYLGKGML